MTLLVVLLLPTLSFAQSLSFPFPGISPTAAAPTAAISQLTNSVNANLGQVNTNMRLQQSFTTVGAITMPKVDLLVSRATSSVNDAIYLELYADSGGKPTGSLLGASTLVSGVGMSTSINGVVTTFTFSPAACLSAATKYHLVARRSVEVTDGTNYFRIRYATTSAYTGGGFSAWTQSTNTWASESSTNDSYFAVYKY